MSRGAAAFPAEGFQKLLEAEALRMGLPLIESTLAALGRFLGELDSWRRRINLTGDLAPENLCTHALESAAAAPLIPDSARLLDIGSGGGFPGVPLAVVRPDLTVTLLEPRGKRASFLRHVVRTVPVRNASVLPQRVESLLSPEWDVASSRALGDLADVVGAAPFLRTGGLLLTWTTDDAGLRESLASRFSLERVVPLVGSSRRGIAVFRKI